MAEACFLASQKARTDALRRNVNRESDRSGNDDTADLFHAAIRKDLRELKAQLLRLQTTDGKADDDDQKKNHHQQQEQPPPQQHGGGANIEKKEEAEPNDHQERIERARETLRTIRTAIATCTATGSDDDEMKMTIHVSDLRWIHRELSDCQERLAALTKLYRPPFSFRRYRAALLAQQQQQQQQQRPECQEGVPEARSNADVLFLEGDGVIGSQAKSTKEANSTKEEEQEVKDDPRRLSGFDAATLRLSDDGHLFVNGATLLPARTVTSGAIVLADITNCTIHLEGVYPSLHLHSVVHSTVHCTRAVTSLHITKCRHTQLDLRYATVQQVRLHDCEYVQVRVGKCIAGIILEHSTDMRFVLPASVAKDDIVHDFGWLRRDKPSPHFTIEHYHDHLVPNERYAAVAVTSPPLVVVEMTTTATTGVGIHNYPLDNNHTTTSSSAAAGGDEKCDEESDDDEL